MGGDDPGSGFRETLLGRKIRSWDYSMRRTTKARMLLRGPPHTTLDVVT